LTTIITEIAPPNATNWIRPWQVACKNKAFIIVLQETHCTTADKLVISNFSQAGSVLIRKQDLATFVHERLE